MKKLIVYIILIIGGDAVADCNFRTANYMNELNSPKYIEKIIVEVPKSGKFSKNFIRILISREPTQNIPPKLRKYFKAKIIINYKFGKCSYKGKVKQNGDWKDHIKLKGGRPVRSLIVKLEEGNIVNAVKFKLLIPETRNNLHEVLGTIVLQNLGYISPLTFQVNTEVNGTEQTMIFQEDSRKELLERSKRRDGPLFEGDESLLWSYKDFGTMTLGNLALSRFTNKKWFLNGDNAQNQVLSAYSLLQRAYLDRPSGNIIKINSETSKTFEKYFFIVLLMNGEHGLRLHNRKFYFNSFLGEFEPIYYDGNLNLHEKIDLEHIYLKEAFKNKSYEGLIENLSNLDFYSKCYKDFFDRVIIEDNEARIFFEKAFSQISFNATFLQNKLSKLEKLNSVFSKSDVNYEKYIENSHNFGVQQEIIFELEKLDSNFIGRLVDKKDLTLKPHDVVSIISDHKFQDRRFLFLPKNDSQLIPKLVVKNLDEYGGKIIHSETLNVDIDTEKKINFTYSE